MPLRKRRLERLVRLKFAVDARSSCESRWRKELAGVNTGAVPCAPRYRAWQRERPPTSACSRRGSSILASSRWSGIARISRKRSILGKTAIACSGAPYLDCCRPKFKLNRWPRYFDIRGSAAQTVGFTPPNCPPKFALLALDSRCFAACKLLIVMVGATGLEPVTSCV